MKNCSIEQELDALLGESLEDARLRVSNQSSLGDDDAVALYGAGTLGHAVRKKLRCVGIEPVAFADDTPAKQGQAIDGVPVMSPERVAQEFGKQTVFVVTILNPALSFLEAKRRLKALTGARVLSFLEIAWQYTDVFLPYGQFELPEQVLAKAGDIRRAFALWEDDESRRQFVAHVRFRLWLDYDALPANSKDNYFPAEVIPPLSNATFVDCGAYDGDTIRYFLDHQNNDFREIFAFEPDETNFQNLREYVATLPTEVGKRIHIYHAGVGSRRRKMRFNPTGNTSAALDETGAAEIDVLPIQEIVSGEREATYVKFDVEGAEWDALEGMRNMILLNHPLLAVSVYHRPDDLWQLPLYLKALNPAYRLFLRTQGEDGMDVICYALSSH
jgi:FkbM family methyltransferase